MSGDKTPQTVGGQLVVSLALWQIEQIQPLMALISEMSDQGKPGMLLAQIYGDHMRVGVLSNDRSQRLCAALGHPEPRYSSSAWGAVPDACSQDPESGETT